MHKCGDKRIPIKPEDQPPPPPSPYRIVPTPADGDCLFHAIAMAENSPDQSRIELRWLSAFALLVGVRGVAGSFLTP